MRNILVFSSCCCALMRTYNNNYHDQHRACIILHLAEWTSSDRYLYRWYQQVNIKFARSVHRQSTKMTSQYRCLAFAWPQSVGLEWVILLDNGEIDIYFHLIGFNVHCIKEQVINNVKYGLQWMMISVTREAIRRWFFSCLHYGWKSLANHLTPAKSRQSR